MVPLVLALLLGCGRPLFYWGSREPVISVELPAARGEAARVAEVHAARDRGDLLLRFSFDRPVREALHLPDGSPVSGRLRAVLYLDADDQPGTGLDEGPESLRTGADQRLELGVVAVGADAAEKRAAAVVVTAVLHGLTPEARRRELWRADDATAPRAVSAHGDWVELRLPAPPAPRGRSVRLVLVDGDAAWVGRFAGPP
jgi:hypothetical protein